MLASYCIAVARGTHQCLNKMTYLVNAFSCSLQCYILFHDPLIFIAEGARRDLIRIYNGKMSLRNNMLLNVPLVLCLDLHCTTALLRTRRSRRGSYCSHCSSYHYATCRRQRPAAAIAEHFCLSDVKAQAAHTCPRHHSKLQTFLSFSWTAASWAVPSAPFWLSSACALRSSSCTR